MINREKVEFILNKYPEALYNRGEFMWAFMKEYHNANVYVLKSQFLDFWREEAGIERTLREVLKEKNLPPEVEKNRYKKANEFRLEFKKQ